MEKFRTATGRVSIKDVEDVDGSFAVFFFRAKLRLEIFLIFQNIANRIGCGQRYFLSHFLSLFLFLVDETHQPIIQVLKFAENVQILFSF